MKNPGVAGGTAVVACALERQEWHLFDGRRRRLPLAEGIGHGERREVRCDLVEWIGHPMSGSTQLQLSVYNTRYRREDQGLHYKGLFWRANQGQVANNSTLYRT
jgi:hypothetical protein